MRGALLLTAVLLAILLPPRDAAAQSVADCMEASPAEALSLCRALIETGRDNADVWAQLTLSLDKSGRGKDARDTLEKALVRYPRDADLRALNDRLAAKGSEEERLKEAGRRNRTAMAQGELKLLCRTRSGVVGIEACRRYLAMTDVDGERIRARLAELEQTRPAATGELATDAPDRPDREPATTAEAPPVAGTGDREADASTPAPVREPDPDPADRARRARIVAIQRALDALGLPVGTPDGIAGRRTREALARFDSLTGGRGSGLDETTLAALEAERDRLDSANATLAASREAARAERLDEALELLARAESESALLSVPSDYRAQLDRRRTALEVAREGEEAEARRSAQAEALRSVEAEAQRTAEAEARRRVEAEAVARSDAQRSASAGASAPNDVLAALMVRIGSLERRIAEADARQRREQERLRARVQSAIGGL